ncbi:MAG: clostripain-related cysteine peptidase [Bdellovibrionota bacterium]
MRGKIAFFTLLSSIFFALNAGAADVANIKEWTFMVFLNGNNNLDSYGDMNINQMETVGSTENMNIVVQWASYSKMKVERLYVTKDNDLQNVTSPVVQDVSGTDMGDWRSLVEFVRWSVANYPAKKYFINVWDHGSGWRAYKMNVSSFVRPTDISWDDFTGNAITTAQLGVAMSEAAKIIGHKVDIYGSDACLMGMIEVADEMKDSVSIFAGSQEVEPAEGWPYDMLLQRWAAVPNAGPIDVAGFLAEEYKRSYQGGNNGYRDVTFSAYDMSRIGALDNAMAAFSSSILSLGTGDRTKVVNAVKETLNFAYSDYGDLMDFLSILGKANIQSIPKNVISAVDEAAKDFVVVNEVSSGYARATGVSIWLPASASTYNSHAGNYATMQFHANTKWGDALRFILQDTY